MSQWPLVIVPVYNAVEATVQCLESLNNYLPDAAEVLLINDASTDPAIAPILRAFQEAEGWKLQINSSNQGFVKTANIGLKQASQHAVLLNSDTIVTPGWLEKLIVAAEINQRIATVTPWTNNGEIVSLPNFCEANPVPANADAVASIIGSTGVAEYPEIPTAVGFCMLITANAMKEIGYFDEQTFGLGYGEENDYSRRAVQAGLHNILCDNAYVCHQGNQSFGPRGLMPSDDSMRRLLSRHPDYLEIVQSYIARDPLAQRRSTLISAIRAENAGFD